MHPHNLSDKQNLNGKWQTQTQYKHEHGMPSFKNVKKFGSEWSVNYLETVHSSFTHSCNSVSLHMDFFFLLGHLMTWYSGVSLLLTRVNPVSSSLDLQWNAGNSNSGSYTIVFQKGSACDDFRLSNMYYDPRWQ